MQQQQSSQVACTKKCQTCRLSVEPAQPASHTVLQLLPIASKHSAAYASRPCGGAGDLSAADIACCADEAACNDHLDKGGGELHAHSLVLRGTAAACQVRLLPQDPEGAEPLPGQRRKP